MFFPTIILANARGSTSCVLARRFPRGSFHRAFFSSGGGNGDGLTTQATPHNVNRDGVDHVVLLKLKSNVTENQINALKDGVASLITIDGVEAASVGAIFVEEWMQDRRGDVSINYAIRVRLANKGSLHVYQNHIAHIQVIKECIAPLLAAPALAYDWVTPEIRGDEETKQ